MFEEFKANLQNALGVEHQSIALPPGIAHIALWGKPAGGMAYFYALYNADELADINSAKQNINDGLARIAVTNELRHTVVIHILAAAELNSQARELVKSSVEFAMMPAYDAYFGVSLAAKEVIQGGRQPQNIDSAQSKINYALGLEDTSYKPVIHAAPKTNHPYVTYGLITVNILMFAVMEMYGSSMDIATLVRFGAMEVGLVVEHRQIWRLITPIFLHIGATHLLFNCFALYAFATRAERYFGHIQFIIIYILSGITGSLIKIPTGGSAVSAGASGAIFGIFGALFAFMLMRRKIIEGLSVGTMAIMIIATFAMGFVIERTGTMGAIGHWAHFGGLVGGFILGAIMSLIHRKQKVYLS